jgi:hypothetical protein
LTTGSDTQTFWAVTVYTLSALLVTALLWIRFQFPSSPQQRRHPVWVGVTGLTLFVGVTLVVLGPMRSGWNALANGGNGSGQRLSLPSTTGQGGAASTRTPTTAPSVPSSRALTPPFQARASGSLREQGPDSRGEVTVTVTTTLQGGARGVMEIQLVGTQQDGDSGSTLLVTSSQVMVGKNLSTPAYRGSLINVSGDGNTWRLEATLTPISGSGSAMDLLINLNIASDNTVSGAVQAAVSSGATSTPSGDGA